MEGITEFAPFSEQDESIWKILSLFGAMIQPPAYRASGPARRKNSYHEGKDRVRGESGYSLGGGLSINH